MKEKFKRYIAIIPAVFLLLLSCVPMLGAHAEEDYSSYHHDPAQFTNFEQIFSLENVQQTLSNNIQSFTDSDSYYYMVYKSDYDYSYFRNEFLFDVYYYSFSSDTPLIDNDDFSVYCISSFYKYHYYENPNSFEATFSNFSDSPNSDGYYYFLVYDKARDQAWHYRSNSDSFVPSHVDPRHMYLVDSNLSEFGGSSLNVSVRIEPELNGSVDTRTMWDGSTQENAIIRYYVVNNGRQNVAYSFYIVDRGFDVLSVVNSNPFTERISNSVKFVHLSEEFQTALTSGTSYTLAKGKSRWRIQRAQSNGGKFIAWGQMNLLKNTQYDVVVLAYSTPLTYIDVYDQSLCGQVHEVYRSSFTLTRDSGYDPDNNSFGNTAYKPGDSLAAHSFSQYYDQDGNLQVGNFTRQDIQENANPDNYVYNGNHGGSGGYRPGDVGTSGGYYDSDGNFVSSSFNSLSYSISGFLSFFNGVWSYIPGNYTALIGLSITALVVVAIFKGVFR